jgi:prepilin-type N-terminal cleavage/methylation domain-containing protein
MAHAHTHRRGFTLIELLVVIGIISILIGITFAVGRSVVGGSRKSLTEDTMRILDTALQAYIQARGENPPFTVQFVDTATNQSNTLVALDGVITTGGPYTINSVGVFVAAAQQVPEAKAILDKLGPKQLVQLDTDGAGPQPTLPTVLDGWGKPIRFVHPKGDGLILGAPNSTGNNSDADRRLEDWIPLASGAPAYLFDDVRRNNQVATIVTTSFERIAGDSDGGKAAGSRPYFYSAGEDGLVGYSQVDGVWTNYNLDNVYLSEPTFSKAPQ